MKNATTSPKSDADRHALVGLVFLFLAGLLWSLNGAIIKILIHLDDPPDAVAIAFYRSLFAGLFLLPIAYRRLGTLRSTSSPRLLGRLRPAAALCVLFFTLMTLCFVIANTLTEAANAIILQYTSTFWVFALSPLILKERPNMRDLWFVGLASVGIAIIFAGNASTSMAGLVIALTAGLFYALLTLMIRLMRDSDPAAITLVNNLGSAALLLPVVLFAGTFSVSMEAITILALMGVVQFGLPYYLYTLGLRRVPASQAALVTMIEPVLVPVWAYFAVGEIAPIDTMTGGAVILLALMLFVVSARKRRIARVKESLV
jgi:drug/metabolite transporter, DME family